MPLLHSDKHMHRSMKKTLIRVFGLLAAASIALAGCQPGFQTAQPPAGVTGMPGASSLKVMAVESFLADIAQNVAGDRLKVETLMPLGLDPHAFEPTPQDVVRIAETQVLIVNGAGFEGWLQKMLDNAGGQRQVIEAAAGLSSRVMREGEQAVMSSQEKGEAICAELAGTSVGEKIAAGSDAASASDLPHPLSVEGAPAQPLKLYELQLVQASGGAYAGMVKFYVAKDGEYVFAASGGSASVTGASGDALEIKETLPLNCAGLQSAILLDLEPGEYILALQGAGAATTPLLAGLAGAHHHAEGDPHFWLDPLMVVKYVENIRVGLALADPAGETAYASNAAAYTARLTELDAWIRTRVEQIPTDRRLIVTNHESFGYFADRYGFTIIGTIVPSVSTGSAPSAQQLARLVDHIRSSGVSSIFLETSASPQLAEQVAGETGVKVVTGLYTHSISPPGGSAPTYIDMMKFNVNTIVEALKVNSPGPKCNSEDGASGCRPEQLTQFLTN